MRTPKDLIQSLYEIRQDAIKGIYDLLKGKDIYEFKEGTSLFMESDGGSYLQDIYFAKKENNVIYFVECEDDTYEDGAHFGDMSTETVVNLYSHINFDINS